jgi:hypothetical protein
MGKLFSVRRPSVRLTKRGLRVSKPSARIGGTFGVNISSRGVHASVRRPRRSRSGCGLAAFIILITVSLLGFSGQLFVNAAPITNAISLPQVFKPLPPTATSTATPVNTPTAIAMATVNPGLGNIDITNIHYTGSGSSEPDEYVEIKNIDTHSIQLQNWTLRDDANHVFTFPSFSMAPQQVCRVYTNMIDQSYCGFSYHSGAAIWNNTGDCAYLRDFQGTLVNKYCY